MNRNAYTYEELIEICNKQMTTIERLESENGKLLSEIKDLRVVVKAMQDRLYEIEMPF